MIESIKLFENMLDSIILSAWVIIEGAGMSRSIHSAARLVLSATRFVAEYTKGINASSHIGIFERAVFFTVSAVMITSLLVCVTSVAGPLDVKVLSFKELDVSRFNEAVDRAVEGGKDWPTDAIKTVLSVVCGEVSAVEIAIKAEANRVENPDSVVVVVARDGFADDSVRGDWYKAVLFIQEDGTWRFKRVLRAFRCYRGKSKNFYSSEPCI